MSEEKYRIVTLRVVVGNSTLNSEKYAPSFHMTYHEISSGSIYE